MIDELFGSHDDATETKSGPYEHATSASVDSRHRRAVLSVTFAKQ